MSYEITSLLEENKQSQALLAEISETKQLRQLVLLIFQLSLLFGKLFLENILKERADKKTDWPDCPKCGRRLHSKGMCERTMRTLLGEIYWERRIGRCPNKCSIGQVVPFDEDLEIIPYQFSSTELMELGCLLAVFLPYETASRVMQCFLGFRVDPMTIWNWVQHFGHRAIKQLESQLEAFERGEGGLLEEIEESIIALATIMGADGVFVPFRPHLGSPDGKTVFREVKIGVIARLQEKVSGTGKKISCLVQKRLVAVLGDSSQLAQRLQLEAFQQKITQSKQVVWLSDGGKWLWNIFTKYFSGATGILDFYHAAQNLFKAAKGHLDGRTKAAKTWFQKARHQLRHGEEKELIQEIKDTHEKSELEDTRALEKFINYIQNHENHITYQDFKDSGIPIGSGFVESACKWLIQQRFKCVGMRWSQPGFNHLLHLRLLWVNDRWKPLFAASPNL